MSDDDDTLFKSKDALDWKSLMSEQSSLAEEIDDEIEQDLQALSPPRPISKKRGRKLGTGSVQKKAKMTSLTSSNSSQTSSSSSNSASASGSLDDDDDDVCIIDPPPLRNSGGLGGRNKADIEEDPLFELGLDSKAIEEAARLRLQQQRFQDSPAERVLRLNQEMITRTRSMESDARPRTIIQLGSSNRTPSTGYVTSSTSTSSNKEEEEDTTPSVLMIFLVNPGCDPEEVKLKVNSNLKFALIPDTLKKLWSNITDSKGVVFKFDGMTLDMEKSPKDYFLKDEDKLYIKIVKVNQPPLTVDQEDDQILANSTTLNRVGTLGISRDDGDGRGGGGEDLVKLKLCAANGKSEKFRISKSEPFSKLFDRYCLKHNLDPPTVRFLLDGEVLSRESTPKAEDLDDDDSIDVQIKAPTSGTKRK